MTPPKTRARIEGDAGAVSTKAAFAMRPQIEEHPAHFLIRYSIDEKRFSQVFSSVAKSSVSLLGVLATSSRHAAGPFVISVIAVIALCAPADPDKTIATLEGQDLLLTLAKESLIPHPR